MHISFILVLLLLSPHLITAKLPFPGKADRRDWTVYGIEFGTQEAVVNVDQWLCGSEFFTEKTAYAAMYLTCEEKMPELNMCCATHDSCYDNTIVSQQYCDEHFCNCIHNAMSRPSGLPSGCSTLFTNIACTGVRAFGSKVFANPKPDRTTLPAYHPAMNKTVHEEYDKLYGSCPGFRKPITTCAYNHAVCHLQMLPESRYAESYPDCRDQLIECVETFSGLLIKENEGCLRQIDVVVRAVKQDAKESGLLEYLYEPEEAEGSTAGGTTGTTTIIINSTIEEYDGIIEQLNNL
ncbi:unnamed protein product [Caenorhabditis sp. 36 PRJEB53466]|nr:unnamed protein product [Caenorhabditis sp. 36 PRJEB53466]